MRRKVIIFKDGKRKAHRSFDTIGISGFILESDWANAHLEKLLGEISSFEEVGTSFDFIECVPYKEFCAMNSKKQKAFLKVYYYEDFKQHKEK